MPQKIIYNPNINVMKKLLIFLCIFAGLIALWLGIGGFPVVLHQSDNTVFPAAQADETVVNPLKDVDVN